MTTFKKVLAIIAIVLATLGILVMAVGIIGAWSINGPITDAAVELVTFGEEIVTVGHTAATRVDTALTNTQTAVTTVDERVTEIGEDVTANTVVVDLIEQTFEIDIKGTLLTVNDTLNTVKDITGGLADTIDSLNRIPFVQVPDLAPDRQIMREVSDGIEALQTEVADALVQTQDRKEEVVGGAVEIVTDKTTEISTKIAAVQTRVGELLAELSATQENLAKLRTGLPALIDLICVILTLVFLFIGLAFASLIMHAWAVWVKPDHTFRSLVPLVDEAVVEPVE